MQARFDVLVRKDHESFFHFAYSEYFYIHTVFLLMPKILTIFFLLILSYIVISINKKTIDSLRIIILLSECKKVREFYSSAIDYYVYVLHIYGKVTFSQ